MADGPLPQLENLLVNDVVMVDETADVFLGAPQNMTISARAGYAARRGAAWGCVLCRFLSWFQKNHCEIAIADYEALYPPAGR